MPTAPYPAPIPGASLLLAFKASPEQRKSVLVIGSNHLAAVRTLAAFEAGFDVVVAAESLSGACAEVRWRVEHAQVSWRDFSPSLKHSDDQRDSISGLLDSLNPQPTLVCVTDTLISTSTSTTNTRSKESASLISSACRQRHIPINVCDEPSLCDFTFPAAHRFGATSLQLALTTNGKACRLASRVKREIVAALPAEVGMAVENVGRMRILGLTEDDTQLQAAEADEDVHAVKEPSVNAPVEQDVLGKAESDADARRRRMRWISQLSEYAPIDRLGRMTEQDMRDALDKDRDRRNQAQAQDNEVVVDTGTNQKKTCPRRKAAGGSASSGPPSTSSTALITDDANLSTQSLPPLSRHGIHLRPVAGGGKILLVGSGPGHPGLLTVAARKALVELGTVILSDKLVPAQVLELIPKDRNLYIAKKYPGNAEGAQNELMEMAVEAASRGETVVRLKQGDPFLYGRGGEEVLYFRQRGYEPIVIPGVSSALAGPLMAGIPVTQRGVAESLTICTGVGRQGREVELPGYERSRSLAILMGVARLSVLITALTETGEGRRKGRPYPRQTPIAVIERASCPDQRVISSTLEHIEEAMRSVGEQRPPAMMIVGWAALALAGDQGDLRVLDDAAASGGSSESLSAIDDLRVGRWLGEGKWLVQEGLSAAVDWDKLAR